MARSRSSQRRWHVSGCLSYFVLAAFVAAYTEPVGDRGVQRGPLCVPSASLVEFGTLVVAQCFLVFIVTSSVDLCFDGSPVSHVEWGKKKKRKKKRQAKQLKK